jgi:hypothetical protein
MDARSLTRVLLISFLCCGAALQAATIRTENFVVTAASPEIAQKAAKCAEFWRKELALAWLNQELPTWSQPCPIQVNVGQLAASGATTFSFDRGEVFGWRMEVNGSLERILDSVIPHEVNHTILASYFRRPLPRWADEGAATLVEADSERRLQMQTLTDVFRKQRSIPLRQLLDIKEYPADRTQVYALYAEGYSLADFLVQQHPEQGRFVYLHFLQTAFEQGWEAAIRKHYRFQGINELEGAWTNWVMAGSPRLLPEGQMLADNTSLSGKASTARQSAETAPMVVRGQDPAQGSGSTNPVTVTVGSDPLPMIPRRLREQPPADRGAIRPTAHFEVDFPEVAPEAPLPPQATRQQQATAGLEEFQWARFPEERR